MRDFKGMKRQRGRNRGGGGQGGGKPQHNINRAFDSQGPDNIKVRGNAQHVYEKYQALARDAQSAGDRVLAENHLQHAEHYFRTLRAIQPNRPASEIVSRDSFTSGYDIDFEDQAAETAMEEADAQAAARAVETANPAAAVEGEGADASAGEAQPRFERERNGGERREWRDRNDRGFNDRNFNERGDRQNPGQTQGQGGGSGEWRDRGDRPRFRDRDDRYRDRDDRFRAERDAQGGERNGADRPADRGDRAYEGRRDRFRDRPERGGDERRLEGREGEPGDAAPAADAAPVSAGSAFMDPPVSETPMLRSEDGGVSELPGFLQAPVAGEGAAEGEGEPRRRTRRRRPRAEEGEGSASEPAIEEA